MKEDRHCRRIYKPFDIGKSDSPEWSEPNTIQWNEYNWMDAQLLFIEFDFTRLLRPKSHLLYGEDTAAVRPLN